MRAHGIRSFGLLLCTTFLFVGCQTTSGSGATKTAGKREPSPAAQRQFDDSIRSLEEGQTLGVIDWELLEQKFRLVVEEDGGHAEAWFNLAVIAERGGRADEAQAHYRRAIEAKPTLYVARENLGVLLANEGDPVAAAEEFKAILRDSPEHAGARARLAGIFLDGGDRDRALELARDALLRDPKHPVAQKVMLRVHAAREQWDIARLVAMRAGTLDPKDPEIPYLLGEILEAKGEEAAALAQFRRSLELSPNYLPARAKLATKALERRNYAEAEELLQVLARARGQDPVVHLDLGTALFGLGKIDEALASYEKAQELDPEDGRPSYPIAVILHRNRDEPELAIDHYRRFLAGSAINLPGSHPVFALMRECEQLIQLNEETRLAEEAAKAEAERKAREELEAAAGAAEAAKARGEGLVRGRDDVSDGGGSSDRPAESDRGEGSSAKGKKERGESKAAPERAKAAQPASKAAPPNRGYEVDPDEPDDEF